MADSDVEYNEQAQKAADEVRRYRKAGEYIPVAAVACEYEVHKNQVHWWLKGIQGCMSWKPVNCKLSAIQEASLLSYICTLDEIRQSVCLNQLNCAANSLLWEDHTAEGSSSTVDEH